jgi:hypothetical protein
MQFSLQSEPKTQVLAARSFTEASGQRKFLRRSASALRALGYAILALFGLGGFLCWLGSNDFAISLNS